MMTNAKALNGSALHESGSYEDVLQKTVCLMTSDVADVMNFTSKCSSQWLRHGVVRFYIAKYGIKDFDTFAALMSIVKKDRDTADSGTQMMCGEVLENSRYMFGSRLSENNSEEILEIIQKLLQMGNYADLFCYDFAKVESLQPFVHNVIEQAVNLSRENDDLVDVFFSTLSHSDWKDIFIEKLSR